MTLAACPMAIVLIYALFSFGMGACIASFLNVVIWRVPRGESIVRPPSHCPKCDAPIRWWQNIPIFSWLILRGRCASCKAPISPRYIFVETLGGLLFLAAFVKFGVFAPVAWVWLAMMIAGSFIDFDHQLLPDFVTIGGMVYGFAVSWLWMLPISPALMAYCPVVPPLWSGLGLVFGFGLLWLVRFLGSLAFRREAMGMGDVLLMGAVGALFGPVAVLATLILSSLVGSLVGVGMILLSKTRLGGFAAIPYGPYICLGCLVWMFFGNELLGWYLAIFK